MIDAKKRSQAAERTRAKGHELHADKAHRLSPWEARELRARLLDVQASSADGAAQLRAVRLVDVLDRALDLEARQVEIEACVDQAGNLPDDLEGLRETAIDALTLDLSAGVADLVDDHRGATVEAFAPLVLKLLDERLSSARTRIEAALREVSHDVDAHAKRMEALSELATE